VNHGAVTANHFGSFSAAELSLVLEAWFHSSRCRSLVQQITFITESLSLIPRGRANGNKRCSKFFLN